MFFRNGPLRTYSTNEAKLFIRDILDGYFPSELKHDFPNGVLFEAVDCTTVKCPESQISSKHAVKSLFKM